MDINFYLTLLFDMLLALMITLIICPRMIPLLHRFKFGQPIREEGPKSHQKKAGTPTMGGVTFMISILIVMVLNFKLLKIDGMIPLFALFGFGIIGLLDDSIKIIKKQNEGLKPMEKMVLLLVVSTFLSVLGAKVIGTDLRIPFIENTINIGFIPYVLLMVFYYAAVTNAVNLTDGLDGLATSVTLMVMTFFAVAAFMFGKLNIVIFAGITIGALLGFLKNNAYPAKIFMGDTGSLALGGVVGATAMVLKMPIFVVIVGGIYVFETLSVIIQVTYYKKTKKRFFKMAPVHHHFEALGWKETKVVTVFTVVTFALCILGILALYFTF